MGIEKALRQPSLLLRFKRTMQFINQTVDVAALKKARILDMGEYNPFSEWLKREFGILVTNTPPDLDFDYVYREHPSANGPFDFVFAFEIIEHLMNPLAFMEYIHANLKNGGRVFLSTPFARPRFLWSRYHVTEYFPDKIEFMVNKAGFTVKRYRRKKVYTYRSMFKGIRPIFRALWFERIMFFELVKK